jgi:hypothetical protein
MPTKPLYDNLTDRIAESIQFSRIRAKAYGWFYGSLRAAVITMSVCAAAKGIGLLEHSAAVLSLLVAIGTGIDTWIKPAGKWKTHYSYNDLYIARESELAGIGPADLTALNAFRQRLDSLDSDYRKAALE